MPEAQTEKSTFDLSGGLNTEIHDLAWPDGFTTDESNYELLSDGTRRRRKGLASEASSTVKTVEAITATSFNQSYKWTNVNGDPDKAFFVHQIGSQLIFTNDDETPSASWHDQGISANPFSAETSPTAANISDNPMRFTQGRGHLMVTGPYIKPFYVKYDVSGDTFTAHLIKISYRDFEGIEDGVAVTELRTDATITADHRYNMRNRGFSDTDLTQYRSVNGNFPGKNALWYKGYARTYAANIYEADGTRARNEAKMAGEVFGTSSAPQGALFLNPFDTTFAGELSGVNPLAISTWTGTPIGPANFTVTLTVTGHGLADTDFVTISGNLVDYTIFHLGSGFQTVEWTLDGTYDIQTVPDANTLTISVPHPFEWVAWADQYKDLGSIGDSAQSALAKSDGSVVQRGFEAIGFHAGRMWYAGMADSQYADHVFFSRICETPLAYGQCHQRQDPTDETFNDITPADGGVLVVPGLAGVKDMMTIGNSLVLIGTEGAWEIAGARGSVFTATSFGVRQLTTANFNSPMGALAIEDSGIALGPSGIYQFSPNEFTRLLEAKNMIEETILTKWNGYTTAQQAATQVAYDDAKRRVYVMIPGNPSATPAVDINNYNEMLIFDVRKSAWFRYNFTIAGSEKLLSMFAISDADDSSSNQKMKFVYAPTTTTLDVADFEQTDYKDFDALESPLPYMVTGFDNIGDFQRRKQTPIITVFQKRTETGFNAALDTAINESSTLMTAFWDWTEGTEWDVPSAPTAQRDWTGTSGNYGVSGKIGAQSEVYRHHRRFIPLATSDVDGYPTVVTRNKVRGRGRVLQLRFDGAATKDSHIIGWTTNYKVSRRK